MPTSKSHNADSYVQGLGTRTHSLDLYIKKFPIHGLDAWILGSVVSYVNLEIGTIFPANPAYLVQLGLNGASPGTGYVQLAMTVIGSVTSAVNLKMLAQQVATSYVRLGLNAMKGASPSHQLDAKISLVSESFVQLAMSTIQDLQADTVLRFPDSSFVKLDMWAVSSVPGKNSIQVPGTDVANDFLSSQEALGIYQPMFLVRLNGMNLIITSFIAGVTSYQTRTKQWMRLVDDTPGGIVITQEVNDHVDALGHEIITTTTRKQIQDTLVVIVQVQDKGVGTVTTSVTELSKSGVETKREISEHTENGIRHTQETKTVTSQPPVRENRQPIKIRNLAGIEFYQWFGPTNEEWAGGEAEGTTNTQTQVQIVPSSLAGESTDTYGNPILARITDQIVSKPTGEVEQTHTEEIGITDVGTTTTDTASAFNGIQTTTTVTTNHPDGSQDVVVTVTDVLTGDSIETATETATSETGQVTITVTKTEIVTVADPVSGQGTTTTTKSVTKTIEGITTIDTTTTTNNDFEDSIINDKIKVYLVQEFTLTCIIDWVSMEALEELFATHQIGYARLELYGQQLGNSNLSWPYRQRLIQQYNAAMDQIYPVPMQAMGRVYQVVFAPSASSFRAKYITGTNPHVYELQLIVQQRSDLTTGARGY